MTQFEKLLNRFLSKPKDFTFKEMKKLLRGLGYREIKSGTTAGSRVAFFHDDIRHIIRIHKSHPEKTMKRYQLDFIEEELKKRDILK
jgi:predicted RNA binding protein YcfA (HicA-like mRNA interferase family)